LNGEDYPEDQNQESQDGQGGDSLDISGLIQGVAGLAGGGGLAGGLGDLTGSGGGAAAGGAAAGGTAAGAAAGQSSTMGMVQDAGRLAQAANQGDAGQAADAAVDMAATGAATYFGGEAGGKAARMVLNSEPGKMAKKGLIAGVGILAAVLVLSLMSAVAGIGGAGSVASAGAGAAGMTCFPTSPGSEPYTGGAGGEWAMKFLHTQGLRGDPLRVMWAIVMRESSGNPNLRTPRSGTYKNGSYDAGLFQTNSRNSASLASYGLTMQDAYNPDVAFNFWMRRASPNGKLMSSLIMWGLSSWDNPTLNAVQFSSWSPQRQQEWIVEPFERYMRQVDDAARQANISIGASSDSRVMLPKLNTALPVTLTISGRETTGPRASSTQVVNQQVNLPLPTEQFAQETSRFNIYAVPDSQKTVSGHEALKPGDSRLKTFTVANRKVTFHQDFEQLFTDFLNAWDRDSVLGCSKCRLNISNGEGPVASYAYRKARVSTEKWSDHAGYAVDIRYDVLPAFQGIKMTPMETKATRNLLQRFPDIGWGGDYDLKYMDEMHFYVKPGVTSSPAAQWSPGCDGEAVGGAIPVSPGASALPWADAAKPDIGYSVNLEGGRNMVYYSQCDTRWPRSMYNWCGAACGPTAMAMIIATLSGDPKITPVDILPVQGRKGGLNPGGGTMNMPNAFPAVAKEFGIEGKYIGKHESWNVVRETLRKGGLVAASINKGSKFWNCPNCAAHYVVIRGMNSDGTKFFIADPGNKSNSVQPGFSTNDFIFNIGMAAFLPKGQSFS